MSHSIPTDDELKLNKLENKITNQIRSVYNADDAVAGEIEALTRRIKNQIDQKSKLLSLLKKAENLMTIITQDPTARLKPVDLDKLQRRIQAYDSLIEQNKVLLTGFENLLLSNKNFLVSKEAYVEAYDNFVQTLGNYQKQVYKYLKMSNRMQNDTKFIRQEEEVRQLETDVNRAQGQKETRLDALRQASRTLDQAWDDLKNYLKPHAF